MVKDELDLLEGKHFSFVIKLITYGVDDSILHERTASFDPNGIQRQQGIDIFAIDAENIGDIV